MVKIQTLKKIRVRNQEQQSHLKFTNTSKFEETWEHELRKNSDPQSELKALVADTGTDSWFNKAYLMCNGSSSMYFQVL